MPFWYVNVEFQDVYVCVMCGRILTWPVLFMAGSDFHFFYFVIVTCLSALVCSGTSYIALNCPVVLARVGQAVR